MANFIEYQQRRAVDRRFGSTKWLLSGAGLLWPAALFAGGVPAVAGLGLLAIGSLTSAWVGIDQDWRNLRKLNQTGLDSLPKKSRKQLWDSLSEDDREQLRAWLQRGDSPDRVGSQDAPSPQQLTLRPESHLMMVGPTRSGKTSTLAALLPSVDVVYMSVKPDSVPSDWTAYKIDLQQVDRDVNRILDIIEPLTAAMLNGESSGQLWLIIDEVLGIAALCNKQTRERLFKQIKVRLTAGAGMGCFVALLMQSPNSTDLGISAALMRNFQVVVTASEISGFDHFSEWSERFSALTDEAKQSIDVLASGYWATCEGSLFTPPQYTGATQQCQPMMMSSSSSEAAPATSPSDFEPSSSSSSSSQCPHCGSDKTVKNGAGRMKCKKCDRSFSASTLEQSIYSGII